MSGKTQQLWQAAISEWESQTCIRFRPAPAGQNRYVTLAEGEKGEHCSSRIGYGRYTSEISPDCLNKGSAMHELGHVLGMHHAHNRPDRDDYIEVNADNISPEAMPQFAIRRAGYPLDAFPYDFDSIMHYGAYAFSDDGEPSITIDPAWRARMAEADPNECGDTRYPCVIGQKNHLSEVDVAMVNDVYLCNSKNYRPPTDAPGAGSGFRYKDTARNNHLPWVVTPPATIVATTTEQPTVLATTTEAPVVVEPVSRERIYTVRLYEDETGGNIEGVLKCTRRRRCFVLDKPCKSEDLACGNKNGTKFVHKAMYSQSLENISFSSGFPFALESTLSAGRYFSCAKSGACDLGAKEDPKDLEDLNGLENLRDLEGLKNAEFTATVVSDSTSSYGFRPKLYRRFTHSHFRYMSCKWGEGNRECQLISNTNCPQATRDSDPRCIPNGIELVEQPEEQE